MQSHTVKLELLRAGPPHNQLLSPLTPYLALCGDSSPITLHIAQEHRSFLSKLERLRYVLSQAAGTVAVPDRVREATADEVGRDVAAIFEQIPSLLAEISRTHHGASRPARPGDGDFVHLSLVLGGSELALIPFEFGFSPQAYPGEGLELCLQLATAIVPTRETRRLLPDLPPWDEQRVPKVLLVSAAPAGLDVPLADHVRALRRALEPWIGWPRPTAERGSEVSERERLPLVRQHLRVLAQASIEQIYEACASDTYSHIHILAHGGAYERGGEQQFGLVLCADGDPSGYHIVSGKRLAKALRAESAAGAQRSHPLVVTLATCDSGNPGSVLVPGGSIAHDLHGEGIPWVFASQFPLTQSGSVLMAESLYPGLLRGDDPRQVLHELRRRLFMSTHRNHDWASIVAYATVPRDFDAQVARFFEAQSRRAIEAGLARADDLPDGAELAAVLRRVTDRLGVWRQRLPEGNQPGARARRAECLGMHGSAFKRIALRHYGRGQTEQGVKRLRDALGYYRQAMAESAMGDKYHWVATQTLALAAALGEPPEPETFDLAWQIALHGLHDANTDDRAWAHGTLAELAMLALHHRPSDALPAIQEAVLSHCHAILRLTGAHSFHVESTRRQFQRYVDFWDAKFKPVAAAAVKALTPDAP